MKILKFEPTYLKDNGLVVIYTKSIPKVDRFDFIQNESGVIEIPPGAIGGNHKHPRIEAFYSLGDLTILWFDKNNKKLSKSMAPNNGKYSLFLLDSYEPHAIVNNTAESQVLVELASESQYDVESVKII